MSTTDDPAFPVSGSRAAEREARQVSEPHECAGLYSRILIRAGCWQVFEAYGKGENLERTEAIFSHGWVRKSKSDGFRI